MRFTLRGTTAGYLYRRRYDKRWFLRQYSETLKAPVFAQRRILGWFQKLCEMDCSGIHSVFQLGNFYEQNDMANHVVLFDDCDLFCSYLSGMEAARVI